MHTLVKALILSALLAWNSVLVALPQEVSSPAEPVDNSLVSVQAGQSIYLEGVIINQAPGLLTLQERAGGFYKVMISSAEIREKKTNPFRSARNYSPSELVPGLYIEVKGTANGRGSVSAREIRFRNSDILMVRRMDARVKPVEKRLADTEVRMNETEQNALRLSGQLHELSAITETVRDNAEAAKASADGALHEARSAKSTAENTRLGLKAANERISYLDDYDVKNVLNVNFNVGSAFLSPKEKAELDKLAADTVTARGYLIEVSGYASSDGDEAYNRRLSRRRADAVIQYLAENHSIPLRRFVVPMGYGEKNPVADNNTSVGRRQNRRVEVRVLVSKGLGLQSNLVANADSQPSSN